MKMKISDKLKREIKRLSNRFLGTNYPLNSSNFFEEDVVIDRSVVLMSGIKIGRGTYLRKDIFVDDLTEIGRYCSIANDVVIAPSNHPVTNFSTHPISYDVDNFPDKNTKTVIGNDVWIGTRAIIKRGVKIGNGAVIASGAVVTKDVEPYAIVAGVPATIIRYRFDEETIKELLATEWWNFPKEKLYGLQNLDIKEAIRELKKRKEE